MKKIFILFVLLLTSVGMCAIDFEVDGIKYTVVSATDMTVQVTGYNSEYEGDLVIKGTVIYNDSEYKIVSIKGSTSGMYYTSQAPFNHCSSIKRIEDLPYCTSIGDNAFYNCKNLMSVGNLSACTSLGHYAFFGCSSLTSVGDLSSCTSIGQCTFSGCSSLPSVGDLSSCTSIGYAAFFGMESCPAITITSSTIPTISGSVANMSVIFVPQELYSEYRSADGWINLTYVLPIGTQTEYDVTISAQEASSALHTAIGENNLQAVVKLKVTGTFNSYDVMIMRNKMTNLYWLDLSDASIVANDYEYYSLLIAERLL